MKRRPLKLPQPPPPPKPRAVVEHSTVTPAQRYVIPPRKRPK